MDFQVNEQTYFLSLAEDQKQWEVFVSTPTGAMSIPVYVDAAKSESLVVIQARKKRETSELSCHLLSVVGASQSEAATKSKEPLPACGETDLAGSSGDTRLRNENSLMSLRWD